MNQERLFGSIGLLADTQYANIDDGTTHKGKPRRFRQSLQILSKACDEFQQKAHSFGIILGDILDYQAGKHSMECLEAVKSETGRCPMPWHFVIGNHDLSCLCREDILEQYIPKIPATSACSPPKLYYDFRCDELPYIRFVTLDAFACSWFGAASEDLKAQAVDLIKRNPNVSYCPERNCWLGGDFLAGLTSEEKPFIPCGGGLGLEQRTWLRSVLETAARNHETCIIFSHLSCHREGTSRPENCMFDSDEVLRLLHEFPGTVAAFFSGHDHPGGYSVDSQGIHHITPPAPIDCAENDLAFGELYFYESYMRFDWWGSCPSHCDLQYPWPTRIDYPLRT